MATIKDENEDLLILSDDNNGIDNNVINLEDNIINDEIIGNNDIIDFTEEDTSKEDSTSLGEELTEDVKTDEGEGLDLGDLTFTEEDSTSLGEELIEDVKTDEGESLDLGDLTLTEEDSTSKEEEISLGEELIEDVKTDEGESLDLGGGLDVKNDEDEINSDFNDNKNESIGNMVDILDGAIVQFNEREKIVENNISLKKDNINKLKLEIDDLKKKVTMEESTVKEDEKEKALIVKNRKALEKMKTDDDKK